MKELAVMQRLRSAGLRPSIARIGVLQVVEAAQPGLLCAEDVFRRMMLRGTRVSIGTVYRVIHEFDGAGLLLREWDRSRKTLYRLKPARFDAEPLRLVCPDSGRTVVLAEPGLYEGLLAAARRHGIELEGRVLLVEVPATARARASGASRFSPARPCPVALGA